MRESGRPVRLHQVRVIGERRFQVAGQIGGIGRLAVAGAQAGPSQGAVQGGSTGDGGTRPPGQPVDVDVAVAPLTRFELAQGRVAGDGQIEQLLGTAGNRRAAGQAAN